MFNVFIFSCAAFWGMFLVVAVVFSMVSCAFSMVFCCFWDDLWPVLALRKIFIWYCFSVFFLFSALLGPFFGISFYQHSRGVQPGGFSEKKTT